MAFALSTLLLVLALSRVDSQRCPSQRGAVFLQFGTRFSHRKGAEKQVVEASPWCYGALDAVAQSEGDSVSTLKDASLEDCKSACDGEEDCKSFTFCGGWAQCFMKKQVLTGQESTNSNEDCRSYYKKPACDADEMAVKVVSYNLYWWNAFGLKQNSWKKNGILNNIKSDLRPDTIGFQECDSPELLESRTHLQVASKFEGAQGIMVKPRRFRILSTGSRDLEATGHWGTRYMTWAKLEDTRSQRHFWHFNTHWCVASNSSHVCDEETRYHGAKTMVKAIFELAGKDPVLVTGDFNAEIDERGPQHFLANGLKLAVNEWVDSIFYSDHWELLSHGTGSAAGSDHHPVYAQFRLMPNSALVQHTE